jgi:SAM-dependent methyltransferase
VQNLIRRFLFNYWYFGRPPWDTGVSPPELLEFIQNHEPGRAIDIGCGTGTNIITLAEAGWRATGVDFAPRAIKLAREKVRRAGLRAEFFVSDATRLQGISGPYDFALDLGCFHGIPDHRRTKYLEHLDRILAPGGFWLLYGFLKPDAAQSGTGLAEADVDMILSRLSLIWRRDGFDKREKPSAWFLFQKPEEPVVL